MDRSLGGGQGASVLVDLLLSMAVLGLGFVLARTPGMSRKRQAWILSALTSMPAATLSMSHVTRLLGKDGWATVGDIVFSDDRLARFLCTFFAAFLLLDLGLGGMYAYVYEHGSGCVLASPSLGLTRFPHPKPHTQRQQCDTTPTRSSRSPAGCTTPSTSL